MVKSNIQDTVTVPEISECARSWDYNLLLFHFSFVNTPFFFIIPAIFSCLRSSSSHLQANRNIPLPHKSVIVHLPLMLRTHRLDIEPQQEFGGYLAELHHRNILAGANTRTTTELFRMVKLPVSLRYPEAYELEFVMSMQGIQIVVQILLCLENHPFPLVEAGMQDGKWLAYGAEILIHAVG